MGHLEWAYTVKMWQVPVIIVSLLQITWFEIIYSKTSSIET